MQPKIAPERPLNPRQLEAFRAVMLGGSMTAGGAILHISQPAVTRLIRDLEAELGLTLFHRQGAHIRPSKEGQQLYREVERHFSGSERIRQAARAIRASDAGHLHIGAMPNLSTGCLPKAVRRFHDRHPNVMVSVHSDSSLNLLDMMLHGQLDLAFAVVPADRNDIDHDPFPRTEAVCIMPTGHRLSSRKVVTVADLDGEDFVSLGTGSVLRLQINAAMLAAGVRPRVRVETVHSATVASYVNQGAGIAVVDPFAAQATDTEKLVIRRFRPRISFQFSAIYSDRDGRSPLALEFARGLRQGVADV